MNLPTPEEERKFLALFFLWMALSVIGAMTLGIAAALALTGVARLIAGWVFG